MCVLYSPPTGSFLFSVFSKSLVYLSVSLYVQSGIKYVLTQGDSIVSTTLATLEDQGKYALSANYGGLIARMIFRPIEDSCRNLFAKLCGQAPDSTQKEDKRKAGKAPPTQNIQRAATTLRDILRFYNIVSLIVFAVGPTAAPLLLRLVAGSRWSDSGAGDTLGTYCYSIPLLAVNGVSEAFVAATASTRELQRQSLWMAAFSVGFAVSAYVFLRVMQLGAQGLVLANCVNMLLRIIFNLHFVTGFFVRQGQVRFSLKHGDTFEKIYETDQVASLGVSIDRHTPQSLRCGRYRGCCKCVAANKWPTTAVWTFWRHRPRCWSRWHLSRRYVSSLGFTSI